MCLCMCISKCQRLCWLLGALFIICKSYVLSPNSQQKSIYFVFGLNKLLQLINRIERSTSAKCMRSIGQSRRIYANTILLWYWIINDETINWILWKLCAASLLWLVYIEKKTYTRQRHTLIPIRYIVFA